MKKFDPKTPFCDQPMRYLGQIGAPPVSFDSLRPQQVQKHTWKNPNFPDMSPLVNIGINTKKTCVCGEKLEKVEYNTLGSQVTPDLSTNNA